MVLFELTLIVLSTKDFFFKILLNNLVLRCHKIQSHTSLQLIYIHIVN